MTQTYPMERHRVGATTQFAKEPITAMGVISVSKQSALGARTGIPSRWLNWATLSQVTIILLVNGLFLRKKKKLVQNIYQSLGSNYHHCG